MILLWKIRKFKEKILIIQDTLRVKKLIYLNKKRKELVKDKYQVFWKINKILIYLEIIVIIKVSWRKIDN